MYSLERNWEMVEAAISDLDYDMMARLPNEHSNSVSWIFGHISRVTDLFIMHRLQSLPQLWYADGWCEKFGLADNPDGLGRTADLANWVPPAKDVQVGYFEAAKAITREYVPSLSDEDLERRVVFPPQALAAGAHPGHGPGAAGAGERRPRRADRIPEGILARHGLVPVGKCPERPPFARGVLSLRERVMVAYSGCLQG